MPEIIANTRQPPDQSKRSGQSASNTPNRDDSRRSRNAGVLPVIIGAVDDGKLEKSKYLIKEVWSDNMEEELDILRELVIKYPYIAMDTEFPGVVAKPLGSYRTTADYHYQTLRCNVDLLKIIQLGLTFADAQGRLPENTCTWQFNFKFSLARDMYAQDSIDLLSKSGIDFQRHEQHGIDIDQFGEALMTSGFVLTDSVKWISFHSGYDFGYLLKMVTCAPLAAEESDFFDLLHLYFPCIYDVKYMMKSTRNLKGGLQDVADDLSIERIGPQHQAGSDSLLTCITFFKMCDQFFRHQSVEKYIGHLYGLGTIAPNVTGAILTTPSAISGNASSSSGLPASNATTGLHHPGSPNLTSLHGGQMAPAASHHFYRNQPPSPGAPGNIDSRFSPKAAPYMPPPVSSNTGPLLTTNTSYLGTTYGATMNSPRMSSQSHVPSQSTTAHPHGGHGFQTTYDMLTAAVATGNVDALSGGMNTLTMAGPNNNNGNNNSMYGGNNNVGTYPGGTSHKIYNNMYPPASGSNNGHPNQPSTMWSAHPLPQSQPPSSSLSQTNLGAPSVHMMNNKTEFH